MPCGHPDFHAVQGKVPVRDPWLLQPAGPRSAIGDKKKKKTRLSIETRGPKSFHPKLMLDLGQEFSDIHSGVLRFMTPSPKLRTECIHTHIDTPIYIHTYIHIYICMYLHICIHIYIYMYLFLSSWPLEDLGTSSRVDAVGEVVPPALSTVMRKKERGRPVQQKP